MRTRLAVVQVLLILCSAPVMAQTGTLSGRITHAVGGAPVAGAAIVLEGAGRGTLSDSLGRFAIDELEPRAYRVQIRRQGFLQVERLVQVRVGDTTAISVALETSTQVLDPVRTEARAPDHDLFLTRPALGTTSLTARSVSAVPRLGEPDIIRIIPLLPGVAARNDFSSGYNVHGGEADQNLILIDGYPIYNPFHLGGLFSTFMESTVRDVTLMTGGFPARYGGRLSSVLDVTSAIEGRPGLHGSVEVSLLGSTATLASPIGTRGSWLVAARRTYADWLIDTFSDEVLPYHFYDLHGHATSRLPGDWRWSVTAYGGRDLLDADLSETDVDSTTSGPSEGTLFFRWGNAVAGSTLAKAFQHALGGDSAVVVQRVSRSAFNTKLDAGEGSATVRHDVVDRRLTGELTRYTTSHQLAAGYEFSNYALRTEDGSPALGVRGTNRRQQATALALFANELWKPSLTSRWLVEGGVRVENIASRDGAVLSPRLSVKRFLRDDLAVSIATGRFTQWIHTLSQEDRPIRFFDLYALSDSATPIASAWHYLAGLEHWMGSTRQIRVNAFLKRYDRVMEFRLGQDPFIDGDEFDVTSGTSYGVDVMLRQFDAPGSRLSGWLTYNYSVARRQLDGRWFAPAHDRRHNVNIVSNQRLGKYTVGARLGIASGTPYTEIVSQYVRRRYDPFTGRWENPGRPPNEVDYLGGPRSGARYPLTQRLDISVSRLFQRGRATIRPYVSIVNAYNARNVLDYQLDYGVVPPVRRTFSQFPFLPSLGVNIAF
jgi:hypothetical protein